MRVTFVLPMFLAAPAGGYKVVYEYANRLHARGHQVTVVHPRNLQPQAGVQEFVKTQLWPLKLRWRHRPLIQWFPLVPEINVSLVPDLRPQYLPEADAIIATAYETAFAVNACDASKGRKFYLIQGYEDWDGHVERMRESWRLPLHRIAISKWLLAIAEEMGGLANTSYIPYGLNDYEFHVTQPIAERRQPRVAMLAHTWPLKGTADGLEALRLVRERIPDLQAKIFGVEPRAAHIPDWCEYVHLPPLPVLREIYNGAAAFLWPSISEGWGLPAMESMACGCALIAAENQGVRDFAQHDVNALLVPIKRPDLLAEALYEVLTNDALRMRLATTAQQSVQRFTWDHSADLLVNVLNGKQELPENF